MKLAILAPYFLFDKNTPTNGTLVQLYNLSMGFLKAGIEVHYICMTQNYSNILNKSYHNGICLHWIFSKSKYLSHFIMIKKSYYKLIDIKPDVIYVRGRSVLQYSAGLYSKKYNINFVWGTNGEDSAEFWKNTRRLIASNKFFIKKLLVLPLKIMEDFYINHGIKLSTHIINQTVSQQIMTKRNLGKKGFIIPNYFNIKNHEKFEKKNLILWLANLSPGKQPEKFIELARLLKVDDWQFIIVGGTNDKDYYKKLKSNSSKANIDFIGKVSYENSFKYFKKAKIFVNTSLSDSDGLPNSFIQSWLYGSVVVSINHNPNEWITKNDIGVFLDGDFGLMREKVLELINDSNKLKRMSENAINFARKKFSNEEIIINYKKVFKNEVN